MATDSTPHSQFRQMRFKSRQIMLLTALDEHRNLHRAAAAIHTTQPAATALLRQMEDGLGVMLFERHARGMRPTAYGEVMIRYARGVLHDFDRAGDEMKALAQGALGLVRIGSVMGGVPAILTQTISRFKTNNPNVHLSIQVGTSDLLLPELLRGDLDVVLGRLPDHYQSDEFDITFLEGEAMSIVARPGHPLFQRAKLSVSDLVNETWILHPSGSPMRRRVEAALRGAQLVTSLDIIETSSILATTSLMEASDMVSVIPLAVAQHYATYGILKIFPVALPLPMAQLGIITPKRKDQSPAMKGFLECLTEIFLAHHQNQLPT